MYAKWDSRAQSRPRPSNNKQRQVLSGAARPHQITAASPYRSLLDMRQITPPSRRTGNAMLRVRSCRQSRAPRRRMQPVVCDARSMRRHPDPSPFRTHPPNRETARRCLSWPAACTPRKRFEAHVHRSPAGHGEALNPSRSSPPSMHGSLSRRRVSKE